MATPIINSNASAPVKDQRLVPSSGSHARKVIKIDNHSFRVTTCHSWEMLEKWIPSWDAILGENQSLSIFSTPEWLGSWWKAFGANKRMIALGFSTEENTLVGLAPFYLDEIQSPLFGKLARLRLIGDGSGDSDGLDVIVRPGFEGSCAQALLRWLTEHRDWDVCSLSAMSERSAVAKALLHELTGVAWPFLSESCPNSAIHLPGSWAQYVEQQLSPGFRPLVTRYPRKLAGFLSPHKEVECCQSAWQLWLPTTKRLLRTNGLQFPSKRLVAAVAFGIERSGCRGSILLSIWGHSLHLAGRF